MSYKGVDRITNIGYMSPKNLTLHDGLFQVHRFVRWVSDETTNHKY